MSPAQRLGSLLIVFHLAAVFVGAMPAPAVYALDTTVRKPAGDLISSITAALDSMVPPLVRAHRFTWTATLPLRPVLRSYLTMTGQFEKWNMFSNPANFQQFVEIRHYLAGEDGTLTRERRLVYPTRRPEGWRLVDGFFGSFTDKAFSNCLEAYRTRLRRAQIGDEPVSSDDIEEHFIPFLRYYARERQAAGLSSGERLIRVEYWHGQAPAPFPGEKVPAEDLTARYEVLLRLSRGAVEPRGAALVPSDTAEEREADITWQIRAAIDFQ